MNPLEKYPHLFANGKFKVEYTDYFGDVVIGVFDGLHLEILDAVNDTLIARPISDMTDKECTESILFECLKDKAEPKYIRKELVEMNYLKRTMRLSLYLLSIGVYPFDQSHFDDGTVININNI